MGVELSSCAFQLQALHKWQRTGPQVTDANTGQGENGSAASTIPGQQVRQLVCMLACCGKTVLAMHEGAEGRRQREEGADTVISISDGMQQDDVRVRLDDD